MLSDWWNGVELWMTGLAFPFQFAIVMTVLLPLVLVVAWLIDRIVDHASALFGPSPVEDLPIRTPPPDVEPTATDADETDADAEPEPDADPDHDTAESDSAREQVHAGARG